MPRGPKNRTPQLRELHLAKVTSMYVQGKLQVEIAEALGIDQSQVSYDLKILQGRWARNHEQELAAHKIRELTKLDELEREAWAAWERSKQDKESSTTEQSAGKETRTRAQIRKEGQTGNPAYLDKVLQCIAKRCEILGLNAPTKVDVRLLAQEVADASGVPTPDLMQEFNELVRRSQNA